MICHFNVKTPDRSRGLESYGLGPYNKSTLMQGLHNTPWNVLQPLPNIGQDNG